MFFSSILHSNLAIHLLREAIHLPLEAIRPPLVAIHPHLEGIHLLREAIRLLPEATRQLQLLAIHPLQVPAAIRPLRVKVILLLLVIHRLVRLGIRQHKPREVIRLLQVATSQPRQLVATHLPLVLEVTQQDHSLDMVEVLVTRHNQFHPVLCPQHQRLVRDFVSEAMLVFALVLSQFEWLQLLVI